ncbi:MAG: hypothetical protein B5M51_02880 [Anaerolinea sp. 4484_236]|nr:MAG: hypothetical protein B5M51_02880 [Anaerolinea sp. 4484_236]
MTVSERVKRLERLLEVARNASADLDHATFLQSVISVASELTGSDVASILIYDEDDDHLHFVAAPWFHREAIQEIRVPLEESIAGWVYKRAQPLVIQDVAGDERFYSKVDSAAEFQTHSILAVPLLMNGQSVGVLEVVNKANSAHYTGEDVTTLETLASLAAITVHNLSLQKSLESTQDVAEQLEQMKSDFIAIASHELRTPLGLIMGHSTFLREVIGDEHHEQLDTIIRSAAKLKEIIESLANVDNFESGAARIRNKKISISRILNEVTVSFEDEAQRKKIHLHGNVQNHGLLVEGDADKIEIVISNLIKNALTFTNEGGHVFVAAEEIPGYVKVSIIDDGIGIPPEDMPHIFERFYQVESHLTRQYGGMGLGLSVAKMIIETHSGRLWAESVVGKGSQFIFLLPLDSSQVNAAQRVFDS